MAPETKQELTQDAKNRSVRTFVQALLVYVGIAVVPIVQTATKDGVDKVQWVVLGYAVLTAATQALLSFVWRRFLDPSAMPSIEPPPT